MIKIVGEAPGRNGSGAPLSSAVARWARLCGVPTSDFDRLARVNLLLEWPGSAGKGSRFPVKQARARADEVAAAGGVLVLVGKRVAAAFGVRDPMLMEWFRRRGCWMAVVPHPSGVNLWYNDPKNAEAAANFVLGAAKSSGRVGESVLMEAGAELDEARVEIDSIDGAIAALVKRRINVAHAAAEARGRAKAGEDPSREQEVAARYARAFDGGEKVAEAVISAGKAGQHGRG
jgi:chorismate mutase